MTATNYKLAAQVISQFEGFIGAARWDVNAWRIGFGSDTRTAAQIKVKRRDTETYADALANLTARVPEFEKVILEQVGADVWEALPQLARAALLSFAYNYGELTSKLESHVKMKADLSIIASCVYERDVDNNKINAERRHTEAYLIKISVADG